MLTGAQCRAARALLGWDQSTLCRRARVARNTVRSLEAGLRATRETSKAKIAATFRKAGIEFIEDRGVVRARL